jgi:hypothetical protein
MSYNDPPIQARLEKAKALLAHWASSRKGFDRTEAVVFMRSRGATCDAEIQEMTKHWHQAADRALAEYIKIYEPRCLREKVPLAVFDARFWDCDDVLFMRAVERCDIGGFGDWIEAVQRRLMGNADSPKWQWGMHFHDNVLTDSPGDLWKNEPCDDELFSLCRCDTAVDWCASEIRDWLRPASFDEDLERAQFPPLLPWHWRIQSGDSYKDEESVGAAAAFLFAAGRVANPGVESSHVQQAVDVILRNQSSDGPWVLDANPCTELTAMCVHGLCLAPTKPTGTSRALEQARTWLLSQQDADGAWRKPQMPGEHEVYLSVLVMDAIELASDGTQVTFKLPTRTIETPQTGALDAAPRLKAQPTSTPDAASKTALRTRKPNSAETFILAVFQDRPEAEKLKYLKAAAVLGAVQEKHPDYNRGIRTIERALTALAKDGTIQSKPHVGYRLPPEVARPE